MIYGESIDVIDQTKMYINEQRIVKRTQKRDQTTLI